MAATLSDSTPQPSNMLIQVTDIETDYRTNNYRDSKAVKQKQIVCSSCGTDLGTKLGKPGAVFVHPFTSTLQCKKCRDFYGDGDFSMDDDGDDKYCRICGNGGELYICGNKPCPYGFCLKCIERYVGKNSTEIEADDWKCLHCNCKPLWEARAICAVVSVEHKRNRRKYNKKPTRAEVYESDDNCSLSEDIDNSYENSKIISRRSSRSRYDVNKKVSKFKNLKQICDSSTDSSDQFEKPQKLVVRKENLNGQRDLSQSSTNQLSVSAKKNSESARANKRTYEKLVSSENEDTDHDIQVKVIRESKNEKYNKNSDNSLSKHKEPIRPKVLKLMKPLKKRIDNSDSSDNDSAEESAEPKKNSNVKVVKNLTEKTQNSTKNSPSTADVGRLFEKVDAATKSKGKPRSLVNIHPSKKMKRIQVNESDTSESDETSVLDVPPNQSMKLTSNKMEFNKQLIDSETKAKKYKRSSKTRKILSLQSNNDNSILDKRKLTIKQSYAKVASNKDYVNKNQAKMMREHTLKVIREMDKLGRALSIGVVRIDKKFLHKSFTKIPIVSKTVLKCALLMNRCKKELNRIDHEFMECYNEWCKTCKVSSIFPDSKDADMVSSSDNESSMMQENSMHAKKIDETRSSSESEKNTDHVMNVKTYDEVANIISEPSTSKADDNHSAIKDRNNDEERSVLSPKYSDHCNSSQNIDETPIDKEVEKRVSDNDSKNSEHNEVSEFDSDEIFSEDESRRHGKKTDESQSKNNSGENHSPETSEKATKSISDEHIIGETDNAESSKNIEQESSDLVVTATKTLNPSENQEQSSQDKLTNCSRIEITEKSNEKSPAKESPTKSDSLDTSFQDIFEQSTSPLCSRDEEYKDCKSTLSDSELQQENSHNSHLTLLNDSGSTLELCPAASDNDMNLSSAKKVENVRENSDHDLLKDSNENDKDLSDCDEGIIFTQVASKDLHGKSKADYVSNESRDDDRTIDSEVKSADEMESQKDTQCIDNKKNQKKTISQFLKTSTPTKSNAEQNGDEIDLNRSKRIKKLKTTVLSESEKTASQTIEGESDTLNKSQDQPKNKEIIPTNISSPNDEENESERNIDEFEVKETDASEKKETSTLESDAAEALLDSEEAIKRKMLEFDSELSDDSVDKCLNLNDFELRLNSDSDEETNQLDSTRSSITPNTSDQFNSDEKSENIESVEEKREKSSSPASAVDVEVDSNKRAKTKLLSSSNSSSSDIEAVPSISPRRLNSSDSENTTLHENAYETSSSSIGSSESTNLIHSKMKKNKLNLKENVFYQTDDKLQMSCEVVLRRLNKKVLDQFKQLLDKSKERQESKKFQSLIDLNTINKRKRDTGDQSDSSSDSASKVSSKGYVKKTKSKQPAEKEETLLDYLEKMKNGENEMNISADDTEENDEILKEIPRNKNNIDERKMEANQDAKDLLIQNSDSENETHASIADTEEEKVESAQPKVKKDKRMKNKETEDLGSNHENGSSAEKANNEAEAEDEEEEEGEEEEENADGKESGDSDSERALEKKKMKAMLAKHNWTLTDSDSSSEQKKWDKSQSKEKDEEKDEMEIVDEGKAKRKKKTKRRVLGSDSDSVQITDESDDDSVKENEGEKKSASDSEDSAELFDNLRKKRRKKRNAAQKTDSDSESSKDSKPIKQKRKRIKHVETDSDSNNDGLNSSRDTAGKLHRKNIRPVLKNKQIADVTKIAGKEEEERLKRISERQKLYNEMYEMKLASEAKVDKLVLDFDEETKKELISVHEDLVKRLKPHQAQGIKFMWDACFESLERTKTEKGSGCIVAHCMGLGKTFQVVTLAHTLLTHPETGIKTVMVVCPLSTVLNWVNEFKKWLGDINNGEDVEVYEMTKMKKNFERKYQLEKWQRSGGVMILGYEMFRLLSNQKGKKMRKSLHEAILKCLLNPGPDLIVCDEGHLLKNEDTALSKAMRRVNTLRRIVLTGTPLQNNLVEYHCMVQFVKPNLLGTKKEFSNRFVNPITNGQFDDSTEYDVKLMKKRAHVLHKMLEGSVQRFDYSVLTPFLPPKQEYVITVRLADIQIKLYQYYIDNFSRKTVGSGTSLFADFQALQRIWTHPIVLRMNAEKMEKINEKKRLDASDSEGSLRDFLDDGSEDRTTTSSDSDIQSIQGSSDEKIDKPRRGTRANPIDLDEVKSEEEEAPQAGEWWSQFVEPEHFEDMRISSKLVLLFAILKESEQIGDKVLVFSQSLYALSLIEEFLNKIDDETQRGMCSELIDGHTGSWSLGLDYFRLDGQTAPENRSQYCKIFNNPKNSRARLFLISTRAGGLGINLTAANRVIIFDASWNPSHDVQSIFRIYRFGQRKPCYVYRFLAQGTMEETIYNRQVTKLSLSCRVVDEQQIERHYSNHDLAELYQFEPNTNKEKPTLNLPKDRLLAEIFRKYEDRIETFHEHDSLLENKAEEELDEEERKEAWKEYEDERMGRKMYMNNLNNQNYLTQQYNEMLHANQAEIANRATLSGINIENLEALIRKDYPNATPEHQKAMTARTIMEMYAYMENETIRQQHLAAAASSFTYPTASNFGTTSTVDKNVMTPVQRQYVYQQQQMQQQQLQQMMQREQQANYAKRFGNVRIPAAPATTTRPPQVVDLQTEENEVVEVPTTAPVAAGPATSSSAQAPAAPAPPENSKRQEE